MKRKAVNDLTDDGENMEADRRPSKQANRRSNESTLEQVVANGEMLPEGLGDSARASSGTQYHQNARDVQLTRKRRRELDDSAPVSAASPSPSPTSWVMPIFPTSGAPMERPPPHSEHGRFVSWSWDYDEDEWVGEYADGYEVRSVPAIDLSESPNKRGRVEVKSTEHEMANASTEQATPIEQHSDQALSAESALIEAGANENAEFIDRFEEMGVEDGWEGRGEYWESGGGGEASGMLSDIDYPDELETRVAVSDSEEE
ncbi:hypothetical protein LTR56_022817 [Elasticomyces elasticus]|nr:hypothetical protein LTR56_022817 [Elasticomyces elasticus]KAK3627527.1 hypothetical protein LTR22_022715 [Elasticomyces elasticus]KAK4907651.1 hypothetical protein LTR49_023351 [Elasticomyces elasticus]KAK5747822.1 hypothetical protein LTS12_022128 [Elasticomyces elasticus]